MDEGAMKEDTGSIKKAILDYGRLYRYHDNNKLNKIISSTLIKDEKIIGHFLARNCVRIIWYFLAGPFAVLGNRNYVIVVTDRAVHFHLRGLVNQLIHTDIFMFDEIESYHIGQSTLLIRPEIDFHFKNGNNILLEVTTKPSIKNTDNYLSERIISYLKGNIQVGIR
jgi:hypothetical protein